MGMPIEVGCPFFCDDAVLCRSWLASEGGVSGDINIEDARIALGYGCYSTRSTNALCRQRQSDVSVHIVGDGADGQ